VRCEDMSPVLALADGHAWQIEGEDESAVEIVSMLSKAMILQPRGGPSRRLLVNTLRIMNDSKDSGDLNVFILPFCEDETFLATSLALVMRPICLDVQSRRGLLVHGALAERNGLGTILAGPSGAGKTTTSNRLQHPWRSLSDDLTLVVCDHQGRYWAHPWPTWSRFEEGGPGGSWDVCHAVPLKGIFFLAKAQENMAEGLGAGTAACMIMEVVEQAAYRFHFLEDDPANRLLKFGNACSLAKAVPAFILHLSLNGDFWRDMNSALGLDD
jgi:SynChlorMet cassette protein ScmC